jgi:hypothetical protein
VLPLLHHACSYYPYPAVVSYISKIKMLLSFVTKVQINPFPIFILKVKASLKDHAVAVVT